MDKILECEYGPEEGLSLHIRLPKLRLLPEETRQHTRAARREMLLALRSLLDAAIASTEPKEERASVRRGRIEVE